MKLGRLSLWTFLALAVGGAARADAPPPSGQKYVGYEFKVEGLPANGDYVLLAWPWSTSSGSPTYDWKVVGAEPVPVGRRSPTVQLYSVPRARWEEFAAKSLSGPDVDARGTRAALDGFVSTEASRCNVHPEDQHTLPSADPRDTIQQVFIAKTVGATCTLEAVPLPAPKTGGCNAGGLEGFALFGLGLLLTRRR